MCSVGAGARLLRPREEIMRPELMAMYGMTSSSVFTPVGEILAWGPYTGDSVTLGPYGMPRIFGNFHLASKNNPEGPSTQV